jgi:hypothetical protein
MINRKPDDEAEFGRAFVGLRHDSHWAFTRRVVKLDWIWLLLSVDEKATYRKTAFPDGLYV